MTSRTTVSVKHDTADRLHNLKDRGESMNDVIVELLEYREASDVFDPSAAEAPQQ